MVGSQRLHVPDQSRRPGGRLTSRLSPYLHFGCLSVTELVAAPCVTAMMELVRQLCWRDFHHQVARAFPTPPTEDYHRDRGRWRVDPEALDAWRQGQTGIPIVDAGMRQLLAEGWMHNRARLLVASFLTKDLNIDWRQGAAHFLDWLVDADVANNSGNWQWVAGTGNDTRPNRRFNVLRQAVRYDPAANTFVATSLSWPTSQARPSTSRGGSRPTNGGASGTPNRSSSPGRRRPSSPTGRPAPTGPVGALPGVVGRTGDGSGSRLAPAGGRPDTLSELGPAVLPVFIPTDAVSIHSRFTRARLAGAA